MELIIFRLSTTTAQVSDAAHNADRHRHVTLTVLPKRRVRHVGLNAGRVFKIWIWVTATRAATSLRDNDEPGATLGIRGAKIHKGSVIILKNYGDYNLDGQAFWWELYNISNCFSWTYYSASQFHQSVSFGSCNLSQTE